MFNKFNQELRSSTEPEKIPLLFGAAYYAEYQIEGTLERDLDLMADAGFNVIRVGESVWSTWEPRNGVFNLDWLEPVLEAAADRGIGVILGTPTYAIPPWLQREHPEIAAVKLDGRPIGWGGRQEVDFSQPAFRWYAERIIRAILHRYATHRSVIGFQVDNEPGLELFHNSSTFLRFVDWLKARYGTVDQLNEAWGLVYWSHRIDDWSQLWTPEGNRQPQYLLEWRRFQSTLTTDLIRWQADVVREYSRDDQFVTTCISYTRPQVSDDEIVRALDVTAGNAYYLMQDGLTHGIELNYRTRWWHTGVAALFQWGDRAYSSAQKPFLVTETNAQSIGASHQNQPPFPGQSRQAALALISRGGRGIEYWNWHTIHFGTETYWGGVLPHSQRPGRIYGEIKALGRTLASLAPELEGFTPHSDAGIIWSTDSKWLFEGQPPLAFGQEPDPDSYTAIFDAHYRGAFDAGLQLNILHDRQIGEMTPEELVARVPILIAPALYIADDSLLDLLDRYATAGGHLIVGIRTGYADEIARARRDVAPAHLSGAAGVWYDEYWNIDEDVEVRATEAFSTSAGAAGTRWLDLLQVEDADVLLTHTHPEMGDMPVVTTRTSGAGRVTYVATVPNPALACDIYRWVLPSPLADEWARPSQVTIASGARVDGSRLIFATNWSREASWATAPYNVRDVETGERFGVGDRVVLESRGARVLVETDPGGAADSAKATAP